MGAKLWALSTIAVMLAAQPSPPEERVRIHLDRSECLGTCADYSVEILASGEIHFDGRAYVTIPGQHTDTIAAEDLEALVEEFRSADFFSLRDSYGSTHISDVPTYRLTVTLDGKTKTVTDRFGVRSGMPMIVTELEEKVDFYGKTTQWVFGDPRTVASLRREGFDFRSQEATQILTRAAARGDASAVRDLLAEGVSTELMSTERGWLNFPPLIAAVSNRNPDVLAMLIAAGASNSNQAVKDRALATAIELKRDVAARMLRQYVARER